MSFSDGAFVRFGGNYKTISVGWLYSWIDGPSVASLVAPAGQRAALQYGGGTTR